MRSMKLIRAAKIGYVALSVALCALGLTLVLKPDMSAGLIGSIIGATLIAFGIVKLVGYFSRDLYRLAFQFDLAFGSLLIAIGALILLKPGTAMSVLCMVMGIEIVADGLFKAQTALDARHFGLERWWLIGGVALLAVVVGLALALRPGPGAQALAVLLGVSLLAQGALNLCVALCAVKIIDNQRPEDRSPRFIQ